MGSNLNNYCTQMASENFLEIQQKNFGYRPSFSKNIREIGGREIDAEETCDTFRSESFWWERLAIARLADWQRAEEVVQEALSRLYESRAKYPLESLFRPYLCKLVLRPCTDEI